MILFLNWAREQWKNERHGLGIECVHGPCNKRNGVQSMLGENIVQPAHNRVTHGFFVFAVLAPPHSLMVFTLQRLRLVRWKAHPTAIA